MDKNEVMCLLRDPALRMNHFTLYFSLEIGKIKSHYMIPAWDYSLLRQKMKGWKTGNVWVHLLRLMAAN